MAGHSHRIGLRFDLERARSLLAEAGYPDGKGLPELELLAPAGGEAADALVEQWAELGARIRIRARGDRLGLPWTVGDSDLWFNGWTADYPDPDGVFRGLFAPGVEPFYHDEEIDELVQRARSLQDQSERLRLYHELDRLWVAEHAAIVPIAYAREMTLRRPWVDRLPINALRRPHFDQVVIRRSAPRSA